MCVCVSETNERYNNNNQINPCVKSVYQVLYTPETTLFRAMMVAWVVCTTAVSNRVIVSRDRFAMYIPVRLLSTTIFDLGSTIDTTVTFHIKYKVYIYYILEGSVYIYHR